MAPAPKKTATPPAPPPPPPAPPAPAAGEWDVGIAIPAGREFGAKKEEYPGASWNVANMPVNASKLIEVEADDNIADETAREAKYNGDVKKAFNRVSNTLRRFKKTDAGKAFEFTIRKVEGPTNINGTEVDLGYGVRFWRIK